MVDCPNLIVNMFGKQWHILHLILRRFSRFKNGFNYKLGSADFFFLRVAGYILNIFSNIYVLIKKKSRKFNP